MKWLLLIVINKRYHPRRIAGPSIRHPISSHFYFCNWLVDCHNNILMHWKIKKWLNIQEYYLIPAIGKVLSHNKMQLRTLYTFDIRHGAVVLHDWICCCNKRICKVWRDAKKKLFAILVHGQKERLDFKFGIHFTSPTKSDSYILTVCFEGHVPCLHR